MNPACSQDAYRIFPLDLFCIHPVGDDQFGKREMVERTKHIVWGIAKFLKFISYLSASEIAFDVDQTNRSSDC